jgi:hypothetical protein
MNSRRTKLLFYLTLVTLASGQTFTREFIRFNGSVIAIEGPIADPVPSIDSLLPSSGAGTSSTFTGTFSDQAGASSITVVQFWFDSTSADCHLAYFPSTNQIYLDSSANNSNWIGNGTPGSGGVLNNGVCTLTLASSSASQSGTTLQVSASLSFAVSGVYAEKLAATNATGTNGWVSFGNWTVGGTVPGAGVYDDRDAHLVYSGSWGQASNPGLYASTESYTQVANDSLTFQFSGTQISYVYTMATNLGYFNIMIDGNTIQSNVDGYLAPTGGNANYLWQKIWTYNGLTAGNHTIKIVATGTKNPSATDTYIAADAFIVGTSYNDNSPSVSYAGTWTSASAAGLWAGDEHYSNVTSNSVTFTFTGTFVTYVYAPFTNMGIANISIDGVSQGALDAYCPTNIFQGSKTFSGLTSGSHTLVVSVSGTKNSLSSDTYAVADQFIAAQ